MITTLVAMVMAFGSESVDGIFGKSRGSCAGGSCSAAPAEVVTKTEPKAEAKKETVKESCGSEGASCGRKRLLAGRRGCR